MRITIPRTSLREHRAQAFLYCRSYRERRLNFLPVYAGSCTRTRNTEERFPLGLIEFERNDHGIPSCAGSFGDRFAFYL